MSSNSFCPLRWSFPVVDFAKGEVRTCCRTSGERVTARQIDEIGTDIFLNTDFQKERRFEMLKGIRHESCSSCWKLEDMGMQSLRTSNRWLPDPWRKKTDESTVLWNHQTGEEVSPSDVTRHSPILRSEQPRMLEVNLSNSCDLKCSYCNPHFSSQWETETDLWALGQGVQNFSKEMDASFRYSNRKEVDDRFKELFWKWFNDGAVRTISQIGIIGGEPFLNPGLPEFLSRLCESYEKIPLSERPSRMNPGSDRKIIEDHKPLLWIVTNLNFSRKTMDRLTTEILPMLVKYFHVEIHASLESVGKRTEYVRFGMNWNTFQENAGRLCALKLKGFNFGFQATLNSLSITTLTDFLRYARNLGDEHGRPIILKQNVVSNPELHQPAILPVQFSYYLEDSMKYLENVTRKMSPEAEDFSSWVSYHGYVKSIFDSIRNQKGAGFQWNLGSLEDVRANFYEYFRKYDEKRGTDFLKTFPEYSGFYEDCRKLSLEKKRGA